jgi:hypothetical protein
VKRSHVPSRARDPSSRTSVASSRRMARPRLRELAMINSSKRIKQYARTEWIWDRHQHPKPIPTHVQKASTSSDEESLKLCDSIGLCEIQLRWTDPGWLNSSSDILAVWHKSAEGGARF